MKNLTELQEIITLTDRKPCSCSCNDCANMCRRSPCLGTPADILALIDNGHVDKMAATWWAAGIFVRPPNYSNGATL